jgi:hypothetical protein
VLARLSPNTFSGLINETRRVQDMVWGRESNTANRSYTLWLMVEARITGLLLLSSPLVALYIDSEKIKGAGFLNLH